MTGYFLRHPHIHRRGSKVRCSFVFSLGVFSEFNSGMRPPQPKCGQADQVIDAVSTAAFL